MIILDTQHLTHDKFSFCCGDTVVPLSHTSSSHNKTARERGGVNINAVGTAVYKLL